MSTTACDFIADRGNEIHLSAVSAWEISLKHGKGRLALPEASNLDVLSRMAYYGFLGLPIQLIHTVRIASLPEIHNDPFDRLLVAESVLEVFPILSVDAEIAKYPVAVIW